MNNHTTVKIGKKAFVIMRNGIRFIDKVVDMKSKYFVFSNNGKVDKITIRSISVDKS